MCMYIYICPALNDNCKMWHNIIKCNIIINNISCELGLLTEFPVKLCSFTTDKFFSSSSLNLARQNFYAIYIEYSLN